MTDKTSSDRTAGADSWRNRVGKTSSIAETFYHAWVGLRFAWHNMVLVKFVTFNAFIALTLMILARVDAVLLAVLSVATGATLAAILIAGAFIRIRELGEAKQ